MIRTIRRNGPGPHMIRPIRGQSPRLRSPRTGHYHGRRERQYNT
ncbi:MAG: hypothetical protein ABIO21_22035 [Pseudomonas sp.]